jgi:hypothetical protein
MKLLRVRRIKVITSKGRINRDDEVLLSDAEYENIIIMNPDAFDVIDDVQKSEIKPARKAEPKRARTKSGHYQKDDVGTTDFNEAWVGGVAPK